MRARLAGSFVVVLGACRRDPDPTPHRDPGAVASATAATASASAATASASAVAEVELRAFDGECHEVPRGSPPKTAGKIVDCPLASTRKDAAGECFYRSGCSGPKCNPPPPVAVRCPKGL